MKMGKLEKSVVNSSRHGRKVVRWAETLLQHIPLQAGQSVLDVGCGVGMLTHYLAQTYQMQATGVDIDPDQIMEAQRRSLELDHVRFFVNDAIDLQFDDNSFDVVLTFKTLHHVPDWQTAMNEMMRVLKPHGYFVFFDLISPQWMSKIPIGYLAGIDDLNMFISTHNLSIIHASRGGLFYKLVCCKPAS